MSKGAVKPGIYQHYKGPQYEVFGTARHSETEELLVVYRPLYGEAFEQDQPWGDIWVRPFDMFQEAVEIDGRSVPRFEYLQ